MNNEHTILYVLQATCVLVYMISLHILVYLRNAPQHVILLPNKEPKIKTSGTSLKKAVKSPQRFTPLLGP